MNNWNKTEAPPDNDRDVLLWTVAKDINGIYRSYLDIGCYSSNEKIWYIYNSPESTVFRWLDVPDMDDSIVNIEINS